jgi:predicted RNA-binding protein with EMAP domain
MLLSPEEMLRDITLLKGPGLMKRVAFSEQLSDGEHQEAINAMVGGVIAKRGYHSVIDELVAAVYNLGEISLADPENTAKMRDFDLWALAVRSAIVKHDEESAFENRVTESDHHLAGRMGIALN